MGENPKHKQRVTTDHPHGEQTVEIHGKNLQDKKGVNIVGGPKTGQKVNILDRRSNERGQ